MAFASRRRSTTERTGRIAVRQLAPPHRQQPVLRFDWRSPGDSRSRDRCDVAGRLAQSRRACARGARLAGFRAIGRVPPTRDRHVARADCAARSAIHCDRSQRMGVLCGARRCRRGSLERPPGCAHRSSPRRRGAVVDVRCVRDRPAVIDEQAAFVRFAKLSGIECSPGLRALVAAADTRALSSLADDDDLTLGSGVSGRTWPLDALPTVEQVPWNELRNVPTAIVTGSNGKTTTVRLLAACARAHGWRDGYNCTDGFVRRRRADRARRLLRPGRYTQSAARYARSSRNPRDSARWNPSPWACSPALARRGGHEHHGRSLRRVRHRRSRRARRHEAGRREHDRRPRPARN